MDQSKIGSFIAARRQAQGLTQRQVADRLSVSDKTISKWETGRGLPEVSLLLPLCEVLDITVNDLLTGETVSEARYREQAEENLLRLMQEAQENRRTMALSILMGSVTIVAMVALALLAGFLPIPAWARAAVIALAMVTAAAGVLGAAMLELRAGYYVCPHCGTRFVPTLSEYVKGYHTFTRRRLTCPACGRTGMCRHRLQR